MVRRNLKLSLGDVAIIAQPPADLGYAQSVKVLPYDDSVKGLAPGSNLYEVFVKPYFLESYRPVKRGDRFLSRRAMKSIEFKVVDVQPKACGIVGPDTLIDCKGDPIKRREEVRPQ